MVLSLCEFREGSGLRQTSTATACVSDNQRPRQEQSSRIAPNSNNPWPRAEVWRALSSCRMAQTIEIQPVNNRVQRHNFPSLTCLVQTYHMRSGAVNWAGYLVPAWDTQTEHLTSRLPKMHPACLDDAARLCPYVSINECLDPPPRNVQSSKSRFNSSICSIVAHSQSLVEVPLFPDRIVCIVDRVYEVCEYQYHMDSPVVFDPSCCSWLRMRFTGTNGDTVEDMLDNSRCCLDSSSKQQSLLKTWGLPTVGRNVQPTNEKRARSMSDQTPARTTSGLHLNRTWYMKIITLEEQR